MDIQTVLEHIYPLPPPDPRPRPKDKPMQVLALGLGRSGTDSLRAALETLGYSHPYHGWLTAGDPGVRDALIWCKFLRRKYLSDPQDGSDCKITAAEFDQLLGSSEAVTDMPCAVFARELVAAYPEAKVILNVRTDKDNWYKSMNDTFVTIRKSWWSWYLAMFTTEFFWINRMWHNLMFAYFYHGRIENTAMWRFDEHNAMIRGLVPKERLLEWTVTDGWEPLCEFLGKAVPSAKFPSGNASPQLMARVAENEAKSAARANINAAIFFGALSSFIGLGIWWTCRLI